MKELLPIRGIITVLNTPFTAQNEVDIAAVRKNVHYALSSGIAGFLVPAMASEVFKLTEQERIALVKSVIEEVNGKVPVIGGASALQAEDRLRLAKTYLDLGCQGILVNIPYQNDTQYTDAVRSIASVNPPFLMLQDFVENTYGLPVKLIQHLFHEINCFRAIKIEVVPAGMKYSEVLTATEGKLHVSGGWAVMQMIEALDRGIHAFMPTGMHEIYTAIYSRYVNGDRAGAQALFYELLPVLAFSNQHLDISIHFYKRLLWKQGYYPTPNVRAPILPFDKYHEIQADQLIDRVMNLQKSLRNA